MKFMKEIKTLVFAPPELPSSLQKSPGYQPDSTRGKVQRKGSRINNLPIFSDLVMQVWAG